MKAIWVTELGGPEVLQLEDLPVPEPQPDEILVRIEAIGVNPVDTYIRAGYQGYDPKVPYTPGFDAAGVVEKTGASVLGIHAGERVYLSGSVTGTYAEYALCKENQIHPLPDHVSFAEGAGIYVAYVTAYRGLIQRAEARPAQTLLVHGASGAVGIATLQIARNLGMRVLATAGTEAGRQLVKSQRADQVMDHADPGHFDQILDATDGLGVDVIMEMMAHVNLDNDLRILAPQGKVVIVGNRDSIEINPRDAMACDAAILGMSLMNIRPEEEKEIHAAIGAGLCSRVLKPVIRCEMPLERAAEAHRLVMEPGACGKIILKP